MEYPPLDPMMHVPILQLTILVNDSRGNHQPLSSELLLAGRLKIFPFGGLSKKTFYKRIECAPKLLSQQGEWIQHIPVLMKPTAPSLNRLLCLCNVHFS